MAARQKGLYDSPIFLRGMVANKKGFRPSGLAGSGSQVVNHPYNKLSRKLSGMKRSRAAPPGPGASTRPTGKGQQLKTTAPATNQKSALPQKKTTKLRDIQVLPKKSDLGGKQGADGGAFGQKRKRVVAEGKKRIKRERAGAAFSAGVEEARNLDLGNILEAYAYSGNEGEEGEEEGVSED